MTRKRVAIVQSSYIAWKGYFDLIRAVDEFILLDEVQFTRRDWRSRNRIKTKDGLHWLSIPVRTSGRRFQTIAETTLADHAWPRRHWLTIESAYARAPHFRAYAGPFERLYEDARFDRLSEVNHAFTVAVCRALGITTPITWSSDYRARSGRNDRLIDLCVQAGATDYLSGPRARAYIDEAAFGAAGISVQFADYTGYPEYDQVYPPFEHAVSVLDLLFCVGPCARDFMKDLRGASLHAGAID
jgi:hypothetical protein